MFDAKKLLDQFLGSQVPGAGGSVRDRAGQVTQLAKDNPLAAIAIAGVLLGTDGGRKVAGSALKLGSLAAIAGLGYQAYKNYKAGQNPVETTQGTTPELLPPPTDSGFHPEAVSTDFALILVRAMIAASRADGHIDEAERARIMDKLKVSGLGADAAQFLEDELANPVDLDAIIGAAKTEEQRVELYTASRLAIEPKSRAERGYLDLLAGRLGLPDALVDHIEATVSAATV
ncbi:tellurite resistance TerB family protein [Shinella yambaruensis]|uniref:Protein YebE n=1 Tax=Shinella yambaruensis TaxID=415996 RepID=A0ABQ5ZF81_9HYPH|nr:tellurite resistance TerB family protein [Shinella yambaruensis]MCJ8026822.1 tellurite resistance TerB family protein [Shinella yambaruensis]MCU7983030.1 tellurite resistance TerB family protein [Shinella yambaruensis]GLR51463.1 protein YebE [Shinella yambaruensis]